MSGAGCRNVEVGKEPRRRQEEGSPKREDPYASEMLDRGQFTESLVCSETGDSWSALYPAVSFLSIWDDGFVHHDLMSARTFGFLVRCFGCEQIVGLSEQRTVGLCSACDVDGGIVLSMPQAGRRHPTPRRHVTMADLEFSVEAWSAEDGQWRPHLHCWCNADPGEFLEPEIGDPVLSKFLVMCHRCDCFLGLSEHPVHAMCSHCTEIPKREDEPIRRLKSAFPWAREPFRLASERTAG